MKTKSAKPVMQAEQPRAEAPGLISPREVFRRVPLSRTTLWREIRSGRFPAPVRLTAGRKAFSRQAVEAWIAARLADDNSRNSGG